MKTPTSAPSHAAQPYAPLLVTILVALIAVYAAVLFAMTPYETSHPATVTVTAPASLSVGSDTLNYSTDTFAYRIVDHRSLLQRATS